ncbi:MAG: 2,3-bisphosphoglycerate-independent phosphoglycerate mutase [Candidatus Aenigmatarchaeota archaeon]
MAPKRKVLLIIRDGWGYSEERRGNAILAAHVQNDEMYTSCFPTCVLQCTGNAVGNPDGVQGGSEVGHLTLGAGRLVWQPYELINRTIKDGSFFENKALLGAIQNCVKEKSDLHISGLFSDAGVHSDMHHMFHLLDMAKKHGLKNVYLHLCLDGRDVPEKSALSFLEKLQKKMKEAGVGKIAGVAGRYYGMDRDTNWDRTGKFYEMMTEGKGFTAGSAEDAIRKAYERGDKTDYYVQPTVITEKGKPVALLKDRDSMIWYNFRSDRSRQLTAMVNGLPFCTSKPAKSLKVHYVCFCSYDDAWKLPVAFHQQNVENNMGKVISDNGLAQLRIAETEKYAHVTFFFNSQVEEPQKGEDRILVPSPKVASYDLKPEMSAPEVTEKLLPQIESGKYDFILLNYANADLVGHSAVFPAVVKACEVVDDCVGQVVSAALEKDYTVFLMADHGNADHKLNPDGTPDPSHGMNPVRLSILSEEPEVRCGTMKDGGLKDVAPTILELMGLPKPKEMTGENLFTLQS